MAKLIESIALSGSRKTDGTPNASGMVWGYILGTSTEATLYADAAAEVAFSQPVVLDAAGKAVIYVDQPITVRVETAAGTSLGEIDYQDAAGLVGVQNPGFNGTLPDGSQGPGGVTDLDAILSSASASFGGTDFKFIEATGATPRTVAARLREAYVSVKDWGAVGNGLVNDTAAIQAATNRVIALGGGTVFFPPGTYPTGFIVNATTVPVNFAGVGSASILQNASTSGSIFSIATSGLSGYEIRDLAITSTTATDGSAITLVNATKVGIRNVIISGHSAALNISGTTSQLDLERITWTAGAGASTINGITISGVYGSITIARNRLIGGQIGILCSAGTMTGVTIFGNYISSTTAIYMVPTSATPNLQAFGNQLISTTPFVTGAVAPLQQWGNGVDGVTSTQTVNISLTPDWRLGPLFRVACTGSGKTITLLNPVPTPSTQTRGTRMNFRLYNNNAGLTTWALDSLYRTASAIDTTAGNTTEITFEYDCDRGLWGEVARATHF